MQSDIFRSTRSLPQTIQTSMNISLYKVLLKLFLDLYLFIFFIFSLIIFGL